MSTASTDGVNSDLSEGLWLTVSELARQRRVDKAAISRRISRLEEQKLIVTKLGQRGSKLINVAQFDKITGEVTDLAREANGQATAVYQEQAPPSDAPRGPIYTEEQARRASYEADLKKLDLDERLGKLVSVEEVEAAMTLCAEAIVRKIDQLPMRADEVASAVGRDGANGARSILRTFAHDLRAALAAEMTRLSQPPAMDAGVAV